MQDFMAYYAEYGAMGVVVALFVYGYIKQGQRADEQADALEALKIENKGQSQHIENMESILLKRTFYDLKGQTSRFTCHGC